MSPVRLPHPASRAGSGFNAAAITRPAPILMFYYVLIAAMSLFLFPFVFLPLFFRYMTLRYRFDDEGVSLSRGVLFRKEVNLTYRRIQDIHVTRNILQRWMGLANVEIQTASGSAGAEMTLEGILQPDALRDYLYTRMRGARGDDEDDAPAHAPAPAAAASPAGDEVLALLNGILDEVTALRRALEPAPGEAADDSPR